MTTITEILAEAFNRVNAEHGVTLSRVEFNESDIEFVGSGSAYYESEPELVEMTRYQIENLRLKLLRQEAPKGATHYGSLNDGNFAYWKAEPGYMACYERTNNFWLPYQSLSDGTITELLGQLTALPANPT